MRAGPQFRTTRDLDLGRQDDESSATADFRSAEAADLGDFFSFKIERTGRLDSLRDGAAVRYHVTAGLAGRRFEEATVDVGFGEPSIPEPELLVGSDLLDFAGIPAIL